jgi:rubrerythrin
MAEVEEFLAHAIRLERDAADRFGYLADAMEGCRNSEVAELFRRLANYSRMHLSDARFRAGFRDVPELKDQDYIWPGIESPETAAIWAADPFIGRGQALEVALEAESAGLDYYQQILDTTDDPEVKLFAREFVDEERAHVAELKKWIAAHHARSQMPALD